MDSSSSGSTRKAEVQSPVLTHAANATIPVPTRIAKASHRTIRFRMMSPSFVFVSWALPSALSPSFSRCAGSSAASLTVQPSRQPHPGGAVAALALGEPWHRPLLEQRRAQRCARGKRDEGKGRSRGFLHGVGVHQALSGGGGEVLRQRADEPDLLLEARRELPAAFARPGSPRAPKRGSDRAATALGITRRLEGRASGESNVSECGAHDVPPRFRSMRPYRRPPERALSRPFICRSGDAA